MEGHHPLLHHIDIDIQTSLPISSAASLAAPTGRRLYGRMEDTFPGDKIPCGTNSASILLETPIVLNCIEVATMYLY